MPEDPRAAFICIAIFIIGAGAGLEHQRHTRSPQNRDIPGGIEVMQVNGGTVFESTLQAHTDGEEVVAGILEGDFKGLTIPCQDTATGYRTVQLEAETARCYKGTLKLQGVVLTRYGSDGKEVLGQVHADYGEVEIDPSGFSWKELFLAGNVRMHGDAGALAKLMRAE